MKQSSVNSNNTNNKFIDSKKRPIESANGSVQVGKE